MNKNRSPYYLIGIAILLIVVVIVANTMYEQYIEDVEVPVVEEDTTTEAIYIVDHTMTTIGGEEVQLFDYQGKPIVINYWASWCPNCVNEMEYFQNAYDTYGDEVTFIMLNVTDGSRETYDIGKSFIEESEYTFPVYFDFYQVDDETQYGLGAYIYGISSLPTTIFVDSEGEIIAGYTGTLYESFLLNQIESIID